MGKWQVNSTDDKIRDAMAADETKAWNALAGYKFFMFGYHAAAWVQANRLLSPKDRQENPFRPAVQLGRVMILQLQKEGRA